MTQNRGLQKIASTFHGQVLNALCIGVCAGDRTLPPFHFAITLLPLRSTHRQDSHSRVQDSCSRMRGSHIRPKTLSIFQKTVSVFAKALTVFLYVQLIPEHIQLSPCGGSVMAKWDLHAHGTPARTLIYKGFASVSWNVMAFFRNTVVSGIKSHVFLSAICYLPSAIFLLTSYISHQYRMSLTHWHFWGVRFNLSWD